MCEFACVTDVEQCVKAINVHERVHSIDGRALASNYAAGANRAIDTAIAYHISTDSSIHKATTNDVNVKAV